MSGLALGLRRPRRLAHLGVVLWCALVAAAGLVAVAVLAPLLAPHDPTASDVLATFEPSSAAHPLGTDGQGRDLLSRLLYGSRTALLGPLIVVVASTALGTLLGLAAAWHRGWVDRVIGRFFDITFSFPAMLLALMFVAVLSPGLGSAALAISIAYVPWIGRLVRAAALREVNQPYVEALRTQGMGALRICSRHVLWNVWPIIVAQATTSFGYAMVELAGISYLGLGVQAPTADWGTMIQAGQAGITAGHPQESLYAGGAVVVAVVTFITLGDALSARRDGARSAHE